jgi:TonB family protein
MNSIIVDRPSLMRFLSLLSVVVCVFVAQSYAQRISILHQRESEISERFSQNLSEKLNDQKIRVDDLELSRVAAASIKIDNVFNLATTDARRLGSVLGTPFFVLVKAQNQRRSSSDVETYYEAYAAVYLVSSSSGRLVKWDLISIKGSTAEKADRGLISETNQVADKIAAELGKITGSAPKKLNKFPPVPDEKAAGFESLRPPMPFRRISPAYTPTANLYGVEATVEIEVDVDAEGKIVSTEIVRWAGYGLDESVDETVRKMIWRPATIGKRTLPMRVLLRYNFKKLEKDDEN